MRDELDLRLRPFKLVISVELQAVPGTGVSIWLDKLGSLAPFRAPLGAWAIRAVEVAIGFLRHAAGLLSDPDQSRACPRLHHQRLLKLMAG
jgi:hypothetical protein